MGITTRNDKVKKNSSERFSYYVQKGLQEFTRNVLICSVDFFSTAKRRIHS